MSSFSTYTLFGDGIDRAFPRLHRILGYPGGTSRSLFSRRGVCPTFPVLMVWVALICFLNGSFFQVTAQESNLSQSDLQEGTRVRDGAAVFDTSNAVAQLWNEGNEALRRGQYEAAKDAYENLLATQGLSVEVLNNLALAHYQLGNTIAALASWECAASIQPRHRGARSGIRWARERLKLPSPPASAAVLQWVSLNEWATATTVAAWIWAGLLITVRLRSAWRPILSPWILGSALLTLLVAIPTLTAVAHRKWGIHGRIPVEEAQVRLAPVAQARGVTTLRVGDTLQVKRRHMDWFEVFRGGKRLGWIESQDFLGTVSEVEGPRRSSAVTFTLPDLPQ